MMADNGESEFLVDTMLDKVINSQEFLNINLPLPQRNFHNQQSGNVQLYQSILILCYTFRLNFRQVFIILYTHIFSYIDLLVISSIYFLYLF